MSDKKILQFPSFPKQRDSLRERPPSLKEKISGSGGVNEIRVRLTRVTREQLRMSGEDPAQRDLADMLKEARDSVSKTRERLLRAWFQAHGVSPDLANKVKQIEKYLASGSRKPSNDSMATHKDLVAGYTDEELIGFIEVFPSAKNRPSFWRNVYKVLMDRLNKTFKLNSSEE